MGFAPEVIVFTRNGKAVAVLLAPADDDDLEGLLLARVLPRFQSLLARSRESIKQGKGLSQEDFWKAVAERIQDRTEACRMHRPWFDPPHPGEFIREVYLDPLEVSSRTVAAKLQVSPSTLPPPA